MAGKKGGASKKANGGMTKSEAVRRAIADLGPDAKPAQLRGHIRAKYHVDMTPGHVKVERQKCLKRLGQARPAAPEPAAARPAASQAQPEGTPPGKAAPGGMSKREAVRQALAELGEGATPTQLRGHILGKFGIEMSADHISTEKGILRRKKVAAAKPAAARTAAARSTARPSAARQAGPGKAAPKPQFVAAPPGDGRAIGLEDIETAKGLVERLGADSLKKLIDVLAR
jgi:hypothetical protein